jgi:hypothetical protein
MAAELTVTGSLSFAKGNVPAIARARSGVTFDVAGAKYVAGVQNIGTSEEAIHLGDLGTPGWYYLRNLDNTNYIEVRPNTGVADCLKLKPGEFSVGRFAADAVPYAIANSGACNLEKLIVED